MKRFISFLLVSVMMVSVLSGCKSDKKPASSEPAGVSSSPVVSTQQENSKLSSLRASITRDGCIAGCAYIGSVLGEYDTYTELLNEIEIVCGYSLTATEYDFMSRIDSAHIIEMGGRELYCIVPVDPYASVSVNQYICNETNNFVGETGEVYYKSETGEPIFILCNESDIVANSQICIVDSNGRTCVFEPYLSLYDGSLTLPFGEPVEDFTHYGYEEGIGSVASTWDCIYFDDNLNEYLAELQIVDYYNVSLTYYKVNQNGLYEVVKELNGNFAEFKTVVSKESGEMYYNTWIDLYVYDSNGNKLEEYSGNYNIYPSGDYITISCETGNELIPDMSYEPVSFSRTNG